MEAQAQQQLFPVFNGDDYELWSIKMKTLLMSRDLWDVIESTNNSDQCMEEQYFKRQNDLIIKDMSALHLLHMSVTDSIFCRIARATSSKQAWELLNAGFGETERIRDMRKGFLGMMFENLIMEEESVNEFTERVMELANRLRFYGNNISDQEVIFKILQKLPLRFHESVSHIRASKDLTSIEVVEILRADEWKLRLESNEEGSGSQQWCEFCRKSSHKTSECYSKNKKGRR